MRTLNKEQYLFIQHVTYLAKTDQLPFQLFLSGGAGVGKSHVISALFQTLQRYFSSEPGHSPNHLEILICAPTGRAAYHVNGSTLHSLFGILPNKTLKNYRKLIYSQLNTKRVQMSSLKILIIDEVSMVGANMLNFINQRMQKIFDNTQDFGNISSLFVGDLFQLRPVGNKWICSPPFSPYEHLVNSVWVDRVQMYELVQIMRQKNIHFADMLNRIRERKHTKQDIDSLDLQRM